MALLPLGVSSVWGGRVPPSRARYNAIDTHGNREGQNVSSVSPCDLRKKLQRRQVCRRPLPPPRTPHATGCAAGRVRGDAGADRAAVHRAAPFPLTLNPQ